MTKIQLNSILNLSKEDKIELVQLLWDNIASEKDEDSIPEWHKELLETRLLRIKQGKTKFKDWADVMKKYKA